MLKDERWRVSMRQVHDFRTANWELIIKSKTVKCHLKPKIYLEFILSLKHLIKVKRSPGFHFHVLCHLRIIQKKEYKPSLT